MTMDNCILVKLCRTTASKMREYSVQNIKFERPSRVNKPDIVLPDKSARDAISQVVEK